MSRSEELLWPRQETLHLLLPALAHVGVPLTHSVAIRCLRRLLRLKGEVDEVSFERWLVVAKEELRWNDGCVKLFWDNVSLLSSLQQPASADSVELIAYEFIAIMLVLHVVDESGQPASPKASVYETAWPEDGAGPDLSSSSSTAPHPSSPKGQSAFTSSSNKERFMHLPKSPRSPKSKDAKQSSSGLLGKPVKRPDHHSGGTPSDRDVDSIRLSKSLSSYALNCVRARMPAILSALCLDTCSSNPYSNDSDSKDDPDISTPGSSGGGRLETLEDFLGMDLMVTRRAIDCLGIILCGGLTREEQALQKLIHTVGLYSPHHPLK